jgi:D-glycero-alpha-D-manno-heptose-7-phosphate kinase
MLVRARAPLRLGLAGGGSDVSPFCDLHGGLVLNATINRYAYATIEPRSDGQVALIAADQDEAWAGAARTPLECPTAGLRLLRGAYERIVRDFALPQPPSITLTTYSDAPAGSGLGASSTLVVAIVKAFVELLNLPLGDYEVARLAFEIERVDLALAGGRQDQYAATFGGVNFIEFHPGERVIVNPLRVKDWIISELEASLLMYFTGTSRESANIIEEQAANIVSEDRGSIDATFVLKQDALLMKESLLKGDFDGLARSMRQAWDAKKKTAKGVTTALIDRVYESAMDAGAVAGKVSGAGGGGYMMFLVNPTRRAKVLDALRGREGETLVVSFTKHGCQGWRVP